MENPPSDDKKEVAGNTGAAVQPIKEEFTGGDATKTTKSRDFMENIIYCLQNVLNFSGRAGRKEFWQFVPAFSVSHILLLDFMRIWWGLEVFIYYTGLLFIFSICVRRLHDTGRSGWWGLPWFIWLIDIPYGLLWVFLAALPALGGKPVGGIFSFVLIYTVCLFCKRGDKGDNKYGSDPLR